MVCMNNEQVTCSLIQAPAYSLSYSIRLLWVRLHTNSRQSFPVSSCCLAPSKHALERATSFCRYDRNFIGSTTVLCQLGVFVFIAAEGLRFLICKPRTSSCYCSSVGGQMACCGVRLDTRRADDAVHVFLSRFGFCVVISPCDAKPSSIAN